MPGERDKDAREDYHVLPAMMINYFQKAFKLSRLFA